MYNPDKLAENIRKRAKEQGITLQQLLTACDLGINAISQTGKRGLSAFSLAKIADVLQCSTDYLLGRTDKPEVNKS